MKIIKYQKIKNNKYKVYIEDDFITLYDDTIIKYNLLLKHNISNQEYQDIINYNKELDSYYMSIKYINKRLRSKDEIEKYLYQNNIDDKTINKTISLLEDKGYINDELFLKSYLNDQIKLTNHGINKIKKDLTKFNIDNTLVEKYLSNIDSSIFKDKIKKYCDKKILNNKLDSKNKLISKLKRDLLSLGYDMVDINEYLDSINIDDKDILIYNYKKIKNSLKNKYEGQELERKIKTKLISKGFYVNSLEELEDEK